MLWSAPILLLAAAAWMMLMPGSSTRPPLPELTASERALVGRIRDDVHALAEDIGERNMHVEGSLARAADWIASRMQAQGYHLERHDYELAGGPHGYAGRTAQNLIAEVPGSERPDEIVVIGAHYDTVPGSPGANDNASAVAVLLALAGWFADRPQPRTVRFVAFVNEEAPFYLSDDMGSYAYAARSRGRGERIKAMISMDGVGYYSDEAGSQRYPAAWIGLAYPDTGNFVGFVTRLRDTSLLRRALGAFREHASIPSEGAALPAFIPGVGWSDHWSFWQHGYPALLVTDTLPFRYPYYHTPGDTLQRLDYERIARVAAGLKEVIARLAR